MDAHDKMVKSSEYKKKKNNKIHLIHVHILFKMLIRTTDCNENNYKKFDLSLISLKLLFFVDYLRYEFSSVAHCVF